MVKSPTLPLPSVDSAKTLGAFYTDAQVADFLVWWAVRSPRDTVMDPSFGGGVFLRSACERIVSLGGGPHSQVFGVEVDPQTFARISDKLTDEFGLERANLTRSDFFDLSAAAERRVDVVIGNPPFIRYQRFSGEARRAALRAAAEQGVRLSELCSSWAPFLVHSAAHVRDGGRLAMVLPVEVGHAAYAKPVLEFLCRTFGGVTFLMFRKKLFPDLNEDTLLLLAEDKGRQCSNLTLRDLAHAGQLAELQRLQSLPTKGMVRLDTEAMLGGRERLIEYLIPRKARELYRQLKSSPMTSRLGDLADVGIGYVTGANGYFHLGPEAAVRWSIPSECLRAAVLRGRAFSGLRLGERDWAAFLQAGDGGYLLQVGPGCETEASIRRYLQYGEELGVPSAYKCRTRTPWYRVPHVYVPDAFLTYMSGDTPRLVSNDIDAVAPNNLHIVRLRAGTRLQATELAALWRTSLTRLSCEIEGHSLGGGMLKLEPTEAENALVVRRDAGDAPLTSLVDELEEASRARGPEAARSAADDRLLRDVLGLSRADCLLLHSAADELRNRRCSRGGKTA
jgi:adenine-specific DNA methylase